MSIEIVKTWESLMKGLKTNNSIIILEDGSATEPVGARKLEEALAEAEGAQGLVFAGKVNDRIFDLASGAGIGNVLGKTLGKDTLKGGVQAFSIKDLAKIPKPLTNDSTVENNDFSKGDSRDFQKGELESSKQWPVEYITSPVQQNGGRLIDRLQSRVDNRAETCARLLYQQSIELVEDYATRMADSNQNTLMFTIFFPTNFEPEIRERTKFLLEQWFVDNGIRHYLFSLSSASRVEISDVRNLVGESTVYGFGFKKETYYANDNYYDIRMGISLRNNAETSRFLRPINTQTSDNRLNVVVHLKLNYTELEGDEEDDY